MNQAELFTEAPSRSRQDPDFLFELRFGLIRIRAWKGPVLAPSSHVRIDLDCTHKGREIYKRGEVWIAGVPGVPGILGGNGDRANAAAKILRTAGELGPLATDAQRAFADSSAADAARDSWHIRMRKDWR